MFYQTISVDKGVTVLFIVELKKLRPSLGKLFDGRNIAATHLAFHVNNLLKGRADPLLSSGASRCSE